MSDPTPEERADYVKYGCDGVGEYRRCADMSDDYERLYTQMRRQVEYVRGRFPDLDVHEFTDWLTALCDRLVYAEAEVERLQDRLLQVGLGAKAMRNEARAERDARIRRRALDEAVEAIRDELRDMPYYTTLNDMEIRYLDVSVEDAAEDLISRVASLRDGGE